MVVVDNGAGLHRADDIAVGLLSDFLRLHSDCPTASDCIE